MEKQPAQIAVIGSVEGDFSKGRSWTLEVTPEGMATLTIQTYPRPKTRRFMVTAARMGALNRVIDAEDFFHLANEYGGRVPDSSTTRLTIRRRGVSKTVTLYYLRPEDPKRAEIRRALHVWNTIRGWFADAEAVDLRPYVTGF